MEKRYARALILGLVLALAPCVQPAATAAVPPLTTEGLTASFDESGVLIEPTPLGRWSWRYTLTSFGRPGLQLPAPPPVLTADAGKRELVRPGLREAYEVKDIIKGFEQTFVIEQPPPGKGSILLEGRVTTNLEPEGGIRLPNRVAYLLDGLPQLQYANLAVYDATGRALAARMDWTEDGRTISLWIDEEGQYPITVDPGIGGCSGCQQGAAGTQCWCDAVALCSGTDCVDPMHGALSPFSVAGSAQGAAFFYRAREPNNDYDQNNMIMLDMNTLGASTAAAMLWNVSDPVDLACSGHSFLPDGRLFMAGGEFEDNEAQKNAYIWRDLPLTENALQAAADPSEMCGQPADLLSGCEADVIEGHDGNRWYPTTIPLWDGRIMVIGGGAEKTGEVITTWNNSYEFYTPDSPLGSFDCNPDDYRVKDSDGCNIATFDELCAGCWDYPHYHATPEGLLFAGPLHSTVLFSYADLETHSQLRRSNGPFSHMEEASRFESASVMLEVDLDDTGYDLNQERRVLLVGGDGDGGNHLDTAEVFDAQATPLGWRWTGTGCLVGEDECENQEVMQRARKYPKTVLLPNRLVLIVGGEGIGEDHPGERSSEIFDPSNETFGSLLENGSGLDKDRRYHSQAFLLPDGRVITAGDDINTALGIVADENGATYNVYYPTYMSPASARPTILDWPEPPETIVWSDPFDVCASGIGVNGDDFHSVILVRPSSTTHSVDFDHRQVQVVASVQEQPAPCEPSETRIEVTLPADPTWQKHVLPPGYYMLIVRKDNGVGNPPIPSVAKFVKLAEAP